MRFSAGIIINGGRDGKYKIDVPVVNFKDEGVEIIFCPSLEISAYGNTIDEAKQAFEITILEFLRYVHNKHTLSKVLKKLGWSVKGKNEYRAPSNSDLVISNKLYNDIVNTREYNTFTQRVELAM